jgi:hypothetical protein
VAGRSARLEVGPHDGRVLRPILLARQAHHVEDLVQLKEENMKCGKVFRLFSRPFLLRNLYLDYV